MNDDRKGSAIEADLGVPVGGRSSRSGALVRNDVAATAQDIQRHALALVDNTSVPQTLVGKVLDAFVPDPIRRERRRGDETMARNEVAARVKIHEAVRGAQVRQVEAMADAYGRACEVQAEEEVGVRALQAVSNVDAEIGRSGAAFDRTLDAEVKDAATLESAVARSSRAERLQRRVDLRAEAEEAIVRNVREALTRNR